MNVFINALMSVLLPFLDNIWILMSFLLAGIIVKLILLLGKLIKFLSRHGSLVNG